MLVFFIGQILLLQYFTFVTSEGVTEADIRDSKVLSLFTVVQFKNKACTSTTKSLSVSGSEYRNGTCLTAPECTSKSGTGSGSCAGGFGVCCVFTVSTCGSSVSQNCSYIQNPKYPTAYTATTSCSYTVRKCDNSVCSIRLDFESFTTLGPADTSETNGGKCQDTLTTTVSTGQAIPVICGANAGQHLYLDVGTVSTDTATLAFAFSTTTFNRFWDIKVTQIPCNSNYGAPKGCLQYHTGIDGRFNSFNWPSNSLINRQHLASQNYRICIRQELGYCCNTYLPCSDAMSFRFNPGSTAANTKAYSGSSCTEDYIMIEGSSGTGRGSLHNRYCGGFLSTLHEGTLNDQVRDCTLPFEVSFVTDATTDKTAATTAKDNAGFCLTWAQEPCAANRAGV